MDKKEKDFNLVNNIPNVIYGTSGLGNLYEEIDYKTKLAIVRESIVHANEYAVFDSAGKYGAGLALEMLGKCLEDLDVHPDKVLISNKLGWKRIPLEGDEPTFEPGVWKGLTHDAVQRISYAGIMECFYQGNELLGKYSAKLVSVHDPDEYLELARDKKEEQERYNDILEAYRALGVLKGAGEVLGVGIGSKKWEVIRRISRDVKLDWVMIANSLTVHNHPKELIDFISELNEKGVLVINSAVFNGGFLTGGDYYNYRFVDSSTAEGTDLLSWRDSFWKLCKDFNILPAEACFAFGKTIPGVSSVALNTTKPEKVKRNVDMASRIIPEKFWEAMKAEGLMKDYFLVS